MNTEQGQRWQEIVQAIQRHMSSTLAPLNERDLVKYNILMEMIANNQVAPPGETDSDLGMEIAAVFLSCVKAEMERRSREKGQAALDLWRQP